MGLKIKEVVDKEEKERERREESTKQHFKSGGLSTAWKIAPVAANVADAVTTKLAIDRGAKEQNPLMRPLVKKPLLHLAAKTALGVGSAYVADKIAKKHKTLGKIVAGGATAVPASMSVANAAYAATHKKKGKGKK